MTGEPATRERPAWLPPVPPAQPFDPPAQPAPPRPAEPPPAAAQAQWSVQPAWTAPPEPPNKPANSGFALSITAAGLLVFTFGLLSFATLPLAIAGWVQGRKGLRKVELGETRKNETLARSAVIVGIVATVISALALAAWIVFLAGYSGGETGTD